jgi:hypothetical protein
MRCPLLARIGDALTKIPISEERTRNVSASAAAVCLRLYVAYSTPNSARATSNLAAALDALSSKFGRPMLEVIDVFSYPKRAMTEGVIVTPTLIGTGRGKRVVLMGDLSDRSHLEGVLASLFE